MTREKNLLERIGRHCLCRSTHNLATTVLLTVHGVSYLSKKVAGISYVEDRINQFYERPLLTTFEVMTPYLVVYTLGSIARRLK